MWRMASFARLSGDSGGPFRGLAKNIINTRKRGVLGTAWRLSVAADTLQPDKPCFAEVMTCSHGNSRIASRVPEESRVSNVQSTAEEPVWDAAAV